MPAAPSLPRYNGPRFAAWLRRYGEAERLVWKEVAKEAGLSYSTVMHILNPETGRNRVRRTSAPDPSGTTLARLADALGLDFSYVASKAGLGGGGVSRFAAFNPREREALLAGMMHLDTGANERLRAELRATLPTEENT